MPRSTALSELLERLTERARTRGMNDSAWAAAAGLYKETLSRLRRRSTCDFQTLALLAQAAGVRIGVLDAQPETGTDRHFPAKPDRDYEERLVHLAASRSLDLERWERAGPTFFMAGLAVLLASAPDLDRRGLLELAERLHPGVTEPVVFERWLAASPVRPSRFFPLVSAQLRHAA